MMSFMKKSLLLLLIAVFTAAIFAQSPSPHDFGKMWTFENPPTEWFKEAYDMNVDQAWFDDVRESSLRFATWCSASFVSPNGLILTNHHCSRGVVGALQHDGESFDKQGFYAETLSDERKADELFVEQLIMTDDITDKVKTMVGEVENDADRATKTAEVLEQLQHEYSDMSGWEGLRMQVVTYYSGGKYSMYGYKRFDDIRLVFIPEIDLGFYGGDPDNFTYPRYNLDCTFWRAYDDDGKPLDTRDNYLPFNPEGIEEGSPVFVVGNPGSTERYRTISQLEYDRDYRYPVQIAWMQHRHDMMQAEYEENPSDDLLNTIFGFSNSLKAVNGTVDGLNNPELFSRKVAMEKMIREQAGSQDTWNQITEHYNALSTNVAELQLLSANPRFQGQTITLLHTLNQYRMLASENPEDEALNEMSKQIMEVAPLLNTPEERMLLATVLGELQAFADPGDVYIDNILNGRTPDVAAQEILAKTVFSDEKKLAKLMDKPKKAAKGKDVLFEMAGTLIPLYNNSVSLFRESSPERRALESKVANETFKVFGDNLPPDATFTLRISDGVVKGYNYNGTTAPWKTTYFGMYDRHYSNDGEFPWSLPERWNSPSLELLKSPINFVSTCDITGGNSGSPLVNQNGELVGLAFDGNIESLPGTFIFDDEFNRTVSVHAGGITAALSYIYSADRLVEELLKHD
jgi:peptidase S46-like protein